MADKDRDKAAGQTFTEAAEQQPGQPAGEIGTIRDGQPRSLAALIASTLQARANCIRSGNGDWRDRHEAALVQLAQLLPSGSGIDRGTEIDIDASGPAGSKSIDRIVLTLGFHHMDEHRSYAGWTDHTITVRPAFDGLQLTIGGRNRNGIKDYLYDVYDVALSTVYVACYDVARDETTYRQEGGRP